jgi:hypothetical protein
MKDSELVRFALSLWINSITTGNSTMTKVDFLRQGGSLNDLPKLSPDQRNSIRRLKGIRSRIKPTGLTFDGRDL